MLLGLWTNAQGKGLRLKNPASSERSKAIISKAESLLLTSELNSHRKSFSWYTRIINNNLVLLKSLTNDAEHENIVRLNNIKASTIMLSAVKTHAKKF